MKFKINFKNGIYFIFVLPVIALYTIFFIFPVLSGFYYSMTDWNGITKSHNFIWFENFKNIMNDTRFFNALKFNFYYSLLLIVIVTVIAVALSLLLNSKIRYRTFFRSIYFFPAVLSLVTVGLIFNEIYYRVIPVLGKYLKIPIISKSILSNPSTAIYGILAVNIWQDVAIPTVLFIAGLQTIPLELYEAATIDGAGAIAKFKVITLPFLIPIFNICFVLLLKKGMMLFDYIKVMTEGGPGGATESIGLLIYNHGFAEMKFSYAISESLSLFLIIGIVSAIQFYVLKRKEVGEQ